jgi:TFIIF-interacting CTD phosphatase-like protein
VRRRHRRRRNLCAPTTASVALRQLCVRKRPHRYRTHHLLTRQVYVRKRPHLDKFLNWITGKFEVVIFTASQQVRGV